MDNFLIGILYFADKHINIDGNRKLKRFKSYFDKKTIMISTSKLLETRNMYVKVSLKTNSVLKYIGYVGVVNDDELMKEIALCNWKLSINKLFDTIKNIDLTPDRIDLTDRSVYTIDPPDCVDIDDGLHYIETDDYTEIGIHIADPSSFIETGSEIDNELQKRIESVYINDTHHMLEKKFMIDNVSLIKGETRRCYSLLIKIKNNDVINYVFNKSFIKVVDNLTYENMLNKNTFKLYHYAQILANKYKIEHENSLTDSHTMVSIYMITANLLVATTICKLNKMPLIRSNNTTSKLSSKIMFKRAEYKIYNENEYNGHKALGLDIYTHFTSPIRRYADIIVHRQLYDNIYYVNNSLINIINKKKMYYKLLYNYKIFTELFKLIDDKNYIDVDACILSIDDKYCTVYCEFLDKMITTKLIHKNTVVNIVESMKITLRICRNIYSIDKIKCYIL